VPTVASPGRTVQARGVAYLHACPRALCPHVEWALSEILHVPVNLDWTPQPVAPGTIRAELSWIGDPGTGSRLTSALRPFPQLRYEVTEESTPGREGERYAVTPSLGLFRAITGTHGDILVSEDRLRVAVAQCAGSGESLEDEIGKLLGAPWDEELEPFRYAGDGAPVRWLHQVV
jgi:hypothetical protein